MTLKQGDLVKIRCEIQPGAFPHEHLITVETDKDQISGFVKAVYLSKSGNLNYVKGQVIKVSSSGNVTVQIPGSFFTSASGVASLSSSWANTNLQFEPT